MSGNGSGPAIMMMPDNIRATFMPDPPLRHLPPPKRKRPKELSYNDDGLFNVDSVPVEAASATEGDQGKKRKGSKYGLTGVASYMAQFERTAAPKRTLQPTPQILKKMKHKKKQESWEEKKAPLIEEYRKEQRESSGEFMNMNCYNTLFVGRLAYEVTERKLLREFDAFGPVKDVKLVTSKGGESEREGKSRGYAFVEFEKEDDMKRAYRAADGMRIEGKEIVVDVERGHTVPNWLPRRLGGGLGGTRLGDKAKNVTRPGRYDPAKPDMPPPSGMDPPMGYGNGGPPQRGGGGYGGRPGGFDDRGGYGRDRGGYGSGGGGGYGDRGGGGYGGGGYGDRGGGYGGDRKSVV